MQNHLILARNNDHRTAERIASFVDGDYLNAVSADHRSAWLDNVGLHARWSHWSAPSLEEAQAMAEDLRSAPNGYTAIHIIADKNLPLTTEHLQSIIQLLPPTD